MSRKKDKKKEGKDFLSTLKQKDGKYILPLNDPFTFGKDEITELLLAKPKAKHIRSLPGDPGVGDVLEVCADLASVSDSCIDELSLEDVKKLTDFFESFS